MLAVLVIGTVIIVIPTLCFAGLFTLAHFTDKKKKQKAIDDAPYHEAGHAILAMVTGMGFQEVSVRENSLHYGHMSYRDIHYGTQRSDHSQEVLVLTEREKLENHLMISMAGYIAEMLTCGLKEFPRKEIVNSDTFVINETLRKNPFLYQELDISAEEYRFSLLAKTEKILVAEQAAHFCLVEQLKLKGVICEQEAWETAGHLLQQFPMNPYGFEEEALSLS